MNRNIRNITIGLIDGIIIPLCLASALSAVKLASHTIAIACIAVAFAGAVTMCLGGYFEGRKYEPEGRPVVAALTIGLSYLAGGMIVSIPFYFTEDVLQALAWAAALSLPLLITAGYAESSIAGKKGWTGALRVCLTGGIAASASYAVAGLIA